MKPTFEAEQGHDTETAGGDMHRWIEGLYPICRSITGDGLRSTLKEIGARIPLEIHEVPSGTEVLDWSVPKEWNIHDAYVLDPSGRKAIDFADSSLHVLGYSVPVNARMHLKELREHLFTNPDTPDWIPYRTSYYSERWGFCLSHRQLLDLKEEGEYEVRIDSTLEEGSLTYGECYLPGEETDEVLISCHCCHPSLCNDNLSGIAVTTWLAEILSRHSHRYSYRFLFIPGTIGSITWLARNEEVLPRISAGLVVTGVGDPGDLHYKKSRRGDAEIDRAVTTVLRNSGRDHGVLDFSPYGYDERQYCSPGFNLPVGCLMRSPYATYPEYHTSGDDLEFIRPESLGDSLEIILQVLEVLEFNRTYRNTSPKGEPQLGKRGLYPSVGAQGVEPDLLSILWVLNLSDGQNSLLDIAVRSGQEFASIKRAALVLTEAGLLARTEG